MSNDFAAQFANAFLGATEFADERETVGYYNAAGAAVRSISAFVERKVPAPLAEHAGGNQRGGETIAPVIQIEVANDSTTGISSSELNLGGDKISVAKRKGGTAEQRVIAKVLRHDAGSLLLEVN